MAAPTDTVSPDTGTSYQTASTYFLVPKARGGDDSVTTDDNNTPGAYFRLGGYSDVEDAARSDDVKKQFYPQHHMDDATSANAVSNAAGTVAGASGIMLACSGRLLIRSAESTYLHSTGKIDVQTESDFTLTTGGKTTMTSGGKIAISSASKQDITITAGDGDANFTTKAAVVTHHAMGEEWKLTDKDSYSMYKCDVYNWKQGGTWDFVAAGKFSFYSGVGLSITGSVDVTISVSAAILFYLAKIEFGLLKIDFSKFKVEVKEGTRQMAVTSLSAMLVGVNQTDVDVKTAAAKVADEKLNTKISVIVADQMAIMSEMADLKSSVGIENKI